MEFLKNIWPYFKKKFRGGKRVGTILTPKMRRTMLGTTLGYIFAMFPAVFSYLTVEDKKPPYITGSVTIPKFRPPIDFDSAKIELEIFKIIQLSAEKVIFCINEILFAAIAMGIAAGLAWWEADIDTDKAGTTAGLYSGLAVTGAAIALTLFAILSVKSLENLPIESNVEIMLSTSVHLLIGVSILYFSGILQIRRIRDISK